MQKRKLFSVISGLFACSAILVACLACASSSNDYKNTSISPSTQSSQEIVSSTPVIDMAKLIRQPPQVFDKSFGKATEVFEADDPGTIPGEIRDYKVPGVTNFFSTTDGMLVRFFKGRAVDIMVDLPTPTSNAEAALSQVGLDVKGISPTIEAPAAYRWRNQTFRGIKFKDVAAHKLDAHSSKFTTVQVQIE